MTFVPAPMLGIFRLFMSVLVLIFYTIPYVVLLAVHREWGYRFGRFYLATWRKCIGHEVIVRGTISDTTPTLFVCNHSSYVDILVLSMLPARFVAKQEVKKWPIMGFLATRQGTLYIERTRQSVEEGSKILEEPLKKGESLILFPEGTTSDGCRILPFKSSFFDVAMKHDLMVQPVTVTYARLNGMPMPRIFRQECGWFSDKIELPPHLWFLCQLGKIQVVVTLHPPLRSHDFSSRKALAKAAETAVRSGMDSAFSTPLYT